MKNIKRSIGFIMIAVLMVVSLSACGNDTGKGDGSKKIIKIGYLPITHALAVFEEKELLDKADEKVEIELQKFSSWTDLTDALNAGKIDGASMLIELAMNAVSQGIDLKAVALGHKDGNVVVVADGIDKVSNLKGKTFAIPSNQSSHNILLNDMLEKEGLTIDDINVTQLAPSEMPSSLASGAIAGYCVAEPFGAQSVVQEFGHVLYYSEDLWKDSVCCALVLNNRFIEKNKDAAKVFIDYYNQAGDKLDVETAKNIATNYLGQDEKALELSLQWIHYDDLKLTKEEYDVLAEKVVSYKINENPPKYEDFVYIRE